MRGVTCSAPNCTVSFRATSKVMMRPVTLSRPVKIAVGLAIFCDGISVITSSPGCGATLAGACGAPRGPGAPGGVCCTGGRFCPGGSAPCCCCCCGAPPGGGGNGCERTAPCCGG